MIFKRHCNYQQRASIRPVQPATHHSSIQEPNVKRLYLEIYNCNYKHSFYNVQENVCGGTALTFHKQPHFYALFFSRDAKLQTFDLVHVAVGGVTQTSLFIYEDKFGDHDRGAKKVIENQVNIRPSIRPIYIYFVTLQVLISNSNKKSRFQVFANVSFLSCIFCGFILVEYKSRKKLSSNCLPYLT